MDDSGSKSGRSSRPSSKQKDPKSNIIYNKL